MWSDRDYRNNPDDEILNHLIERIQLGEASAVAEYLNRLRNLISNLDLIIETPKGSILQKLLYSLNSGRGVDQTTFSAIEDLIKAIYGPNATSILNKWTQESNSPVQTTFWIDNKGFIQICQELQIKYQCYSCLTDLSGAARASITIEYGDRIVRSGIFYCELCERFFGPECSSAEPINICQRCRDLVRMSQTRPNSY